MLLLTTSGTVSRMPGCMMNITVCTVRSVSFQYHDTSHKEREATKRVRLRYNKAEQRGSEVEWEGRSLTHDGTRAALSLTGI